MRHPVRAITFDAAFTLIQVRWSPGKVAMRCANEIGLVLPQEAEAMYFDRVRGRWPEFVQLNLQRDVNVAAGFWLSVTERWLLELGQDPGRAREISAVGDRLLYETRDYFDVYDDVIETLETLQAKGVTLGVISNWDISLHRVMCSLDLTKYFKTVVASLEEGPEKPDPRLFGIALGRLGSKAEETMHVGDDMTDDLGGARSAGMRALLIDRGRTDDAPPFIHTLRSVPGLLETV